MADELLLDLDGMDRPVETGRALVLSDFALPSLGPGERFLRFAYALGVSGTVLTSPLRKASKPRLLATVHNPLPGDGVAGSALRAGHFLIYGHKLLITQVDFSGETRLAPSVERVVHGFHWLNDLEAAGPREIIAPVAARLLSAWLASNTEPAPRAIRNSARPNSARPNSARPNSAWSVGNAGARLMACLIHAPLILSGPDRLLRARVGTMIADTARWLDRQVGRAEDNLAALNGWSAIVAAGLLLSEGRPRRLFGEAGLMHTLGDLVGDDGGVMSRSPLGQIDSIATLIRLKACYRATRRNPPAAIETILARMVPPLLSLIHGDGSLGSWQGSWAIPAEEITALIVASGVRARPLRDTQQWGYQRVQAGKGLLLFDAAPPPLARHVRHGCASTLAFEFSDGAHRLIVNCGGSGAAGGLLPLRYEQGLRASAAHSALILDDTNSTAVLMQGVLGAGVKEVEINRRMLEGDRESSSGARVRWRATRIEASHDGYVARFGLLHRRILILRDDGLELRGEDSLIPSKNKRKNAMIGLAIRFHLGPEVVAEYTEDGQGVILAIPDGGFWQFRTASGQVTIDESIWTDGRGCPVPIQQLVVQGSVPRGGASFGWLFKKMG